VRRGMINKIVLSMATLRILSGSIELLAAYLIWRSNQIDKALLINSSLAMVGPLIFLMVTMLGLTGMADKLSWTKLIWIAIGLCCIFFGILKK
jgi:putative exporter of polyketide antibiotics